MKKLLSIIFLGLLWCNASFAEAVDLSKREVHESKLDKRLWVVNFTLDPSSMNRKVWVPEYARLVFSAFGGIVSPEADVNFLEHHRHSHLPKKEGTGRICPATLPQTRERSCDACRCKRCFVPV